MGTLALAATVAAAVDLPVIAAGGIMDGRGVAAAPGAGRQRRADGHRLPAGRAGHHQRPWRRAIEAAPDDPTRLTRAFSGRYARGIENRFMREMRSVEREVPAYPVQNRLTQPLRAAAAASGDAQMLSLWAGQAVKLAKPGDAGEMVRRWWAEAKAAARSLAARTGVA